MYPPPRPVDNEAVCILCGETYHHCENRSRFDRHKNSREHKEAIALLSKIDEVDDEEEGVEDEDGEEEEEEDED